MGDRNGAMYTYVTFSSNKNKNAKVSKKKITLPLFVVK